MRNGSMARTAGLALILALASVGVMGTAAMTETAPAATHTVFAEFGTATW